MAFKKKYETEKRDYRRELSDKVAAQMEDLIADIENPSGKGWKKSWFVCNEPPYNPVTETNYRGINFVSLISEGYSDPRFATYNNIADMERQRLSAHKDLAALAAAELSPVDRLAKSSEIENRFVALEKLGLADRDLPIHVRKGAKASPVFKAMQVAMGGNDQEEGAEESESKGSETKLVWRQVFAGNVFNYSQVENTTQHMARTLDFVPHEEAELHVAAMCAKTGLKLTHNDGGRAFYRPSTHEIVMPHKERFDSVNAYYDTLLHEKGHSTGPALGRDMSGVFGSPSYAREELVAELSSVMLGASLGIPHDSSSHENNVAYLKGWLTAIKGDDKNKPDKNLIFKAASDASKSVEYQNAIRQEYKQELEQKIKLDTAPKVEPQKIQLKQEIALSM